MMAHDATTLNLASIVEFHAGLHPHRLAVAFGDRRLSYTQLDAGANQVAAALAARGIGPGDHVALLCPNLPYFPVVYFGILKAGAVVVPLNVLFKPRDIAYHLEDSDAKMLFCFEGTPELPMAAAAKEALASAPACREMVVMTANPAAPSPIAGTAGFAELVGSQPLTSVVTPRRPDDTAVILYTSGTTGRPKGAELTHANVLLNSMVTWSLIAPLADYGRDGRNVNLITLPLFHSTGQIAQMTASLYGGMTIVLLPRFEPAAVLQTMVEHGVTFWTGVPTMYWMLLQHARANGVDPAPVAATLRACFSGGAPMPVELMKEFEQTFTVRVLEGYGLSETSPVASFNHLDRPARPGTVGQPIFGVEIRCVDESDHPVRPEEPGEVVIRGHNIMKGYYKQPDETALAIRGGWFHTGDVGTIDTEGYLSIIDRKKDMILRGGYNVYPRELEEVLLTHPAVSLAAVVGVPDEKYGEEITAYVVVKPGAALTGDELDGWCRERFAAYKCPRLFEFRTSLPISATGKVLKRELRVTRP